MASTSSPSSVATTDSITESPLDSILSAIPHEVTMEAMNRSFEAMWYQAEVLHKREIDVLKQNAKEGNELIDALKTALKDMIYQFSQDIIATFRDMRIFEESRLMQIIDMLFALLNDTPFPPLPLLERNAVLKMEDVKEEEEEDFPPTNINGILADVPELAVPADL